MLKKYYFLLFSLLSIIFFNFYAMRYVVTNVDKVNGKKSFMIERVIKDKDNDKIKVVVGQFIPRRCEIDFCKKDLGLLKKKFKKLCEKFFKDREVLGLIKSLVDRNYKLLPILQTGEFVMQAQDRLENKFSSSFLFSFSKDELLMVLEHIKRQKMFILNNEYTNKFNRLINNLEAINIEEKDLTVCFDYYKKDYFSKDDVLRMVQKYKRELGYNFNSLKEKERVFNLYKKLLLCLKILKIEGFFV